MSDSVALEGYSEMMRILKIGGSSDGNGIRNQQERERIGKPDTKPREGWRVTTAEQIDMKTKGRKENGMKRINKKRIKLESKRKEKTWERASGE